MTSDNPVSLAEKVMSARISFSCRSVKFQNTTTPYPKMNISPNDIASGETRGGDNDLLGLYLGEGDSERIASS